MEESEKPPHADRTSGVAELLHDLRSSQLRRAPQPRRTVLSVGCAGSWYFEWFNRCCGRPARHIGLELYQERPAALPPEVEWQCGAASDMGRVQDASVDLVFSGQNLEHLWPDEAVGFLMESRRVLEPAGHLVLDSPNREVTSGLMWMHHEHVLEYSIGEIQSLLAACGFEVTRTAGIWLCRDHGTGRLLPLEPDSDASAWSTSRRIREAAERPRDSFIWWVEASPGKQPPDAARLSETMAEIGARAREERLQRWEGCVGERVASRGGDWVGAACGEAGVLRYGPYVPLKRGPHRVSFECRAEQPAAGDAVALVLDVIAQRGDHGPICRREVSLQQLRTGDVISVDLDFDLPQATFGVEFRAISTGVTRIAVNPRVVVEEPR
jgi:SAM-dependent methyltransferase